MEAGLSKRGDRMYCYKGLKGKQKNGTKLGWKLGGQGRRGKSGEIKNTKDLF